MKKYIFFILVLASCNSSTEDFKSSENIKISSYDSLLNTADSFNIKIDSLDYYSTGVTFLLEKKIIELNQLREEKNLLQQQMMYELNLGDQKIADSQNIVDDDNEEKDERIEYLVSRMNEYEKEISRLRKKLRFDSLYFARIDKIDKRETIIEKFNDSSLIIEFDTKIKGGEIPIENISVFIIPYDKKKVKRLMQYDIFCDMRDITSLNALQAKYFAGKYYFNDVSPGRYLIKVCHYYGGYQVIERTEGQQIVTMQVSPPLQ